VLVDASRASLDLLVSPSLQGRRHGDAGSRRDRAELIWRLEDLSAVLRPELGDQAPAPVGVGLVPEPDAPSANTATLGERPCHGHRSPPSIVWLLRRQRSSRGSSVDSLSSNRCRLSEPGDGTGPDAPPASIGWPSRPSRSRNRRRAHPFLAHPRRSQAARAVPGRERLCQAPELRRDRPVQPESPAPRPPGPAPRSADRRAQSTAARRRLCASLCRSREDADPALAKLVAEVEAYLRRAAPPNR
jgi:hypothetical protein